MNPRSSTKPGLQRQSVIELAMTMADTEGLESVTIRRLAQVVGVTPMALYWHFADKEALLLAMGERLWDDTMAELSAGTEKSGWDEVYRVTVALVGVLRRHPGCAELAPAAVLACESGRDVTERALSLLASEGLGPERASELAHFLLMTAVSLVSTQPGLDLDATDKEEVMRTKRAALASLPVERYPHLTATASFLVDCPDDDAYFRRGVDFVVGGLRHQASSTASGDLPDAGASATSTTAASAATASSSVKTAAAPRRGRRTA